MIDLVLHIGKRPGGVNPLHRAVSSIPYYEKFRSCEEFFTRENISGYYNNFISPKLSDILFEDNDTYYFVLGKVLSRTKSGTSSSVQLGIKEVIAAYKNSKSPFHERVKGDYLLVSIERVTGKVIVLNSPLGVRSFFYYTDQKQIILSTNLTILLTLIETIQVNEVGLVMYSLFDTLLGNSTLIRNVYSLQFGERVDISNGRIDSEIYYNHLKCFTLKPANRKDSIEILASILKNNMANMPTNNPFLLGLTGGFDSRLNLALIDKSDYHNIIGYTYGMEGSKEIEIANLIARLYGLRYEVVTLGQDYINQYLLNSDETLLIGDGFAPFMRCNYLYAHRILSSYSRECLTGMFGSELIRPMHVMPDAVSLTQDTVKAFMSKEPLRHFEQIFEYRRQEGYFRQDLFNASVRDEILGLIEKQYLRSKIAPKKEHILHNFYINEGMRKFFMEIIRVDRFFVNHNLPFLDLDFFEELMQTEYAGIHNNAYKANPYARRQGQLLYVHVMERFASELNYLKVDRGYYPNQLKGGFNWISVALGFYFGKKLRKKIKGNDTFNTKVWRANVYKANIQTLKAKDPWFSETLLNRYLEKHHLISKNEHIYARHYSIKRWLELIQRYVTI